MMFYTISNAYYSYTSLAGKHSLRFMFIEVNYSWETWLYLCKTEENINKRKLL